MNALLNLFQSLYSVVAPRSPDDKARSFQSEIDVFAVRNAVLFARQTAKREDIYLVHCFCVRSMHTTLPSERDTTEIQTVRCTCIVSDVSADFLIRSTQIATHTKVALHVRQRISDCR